MNRTVEQFVADVVESELLSESDVRGVLNHLVPEKRDGDAQGLARELVRRKKLTSFQASAIYQGKVQSLCLDNYVVLEKLGEGGMGMVFKARHRRIQRVVALKLLPPVATKSPDAVQRFHREVEVAARLTHPNIVAAYDAGEANGAHFLVMEYVPGHDLSRVVKNEGPLAVDRAVLCILQVARGLEHAHAAGVVHRDIKPANLLLDDEGVVKILDMGLARINDASTEGRHDLTHTGHIMGTVDYMSPEQALQTKSADHRADIYSLGCSLYFLLTGRTVYEGDTLMSKLMAHREQSIPRLALPEGEVPSALEAVFQRMIAKHIAERYQSMTEVIRDLEACLAGKQVAACGPFTPFEHSSGDAWTGPASDSFSANSKSPALLPPIGSAETVAGRAGSSTWSSRSKSRVKRGSFRVNGPLVWMSGAVVVVAMLSGVWLSTRRQESTAPSRPRNPAERNSAAVSGKRVTSQPSAVPSGASVQKEKQAAVWILQNGGTLQVETEIGKRVSVEKLAELPTLNYSVLQFAIKKSPRPIGAGLKNVSGLERLNFIDLQSTNLTDYGIEQLCDLPGLKRMNLHSTFLTDGGLEHLATFSSLESLNINNIKGFSHAGLSHLRRMPQLKMLDVGQSPFNDNDTDHVTELVNLTSLSLGSTNISDLSLEKIQGLTGLTELSLMNTRITDEGLKLLQAFPLLKSLDISRNRITNQAVANLRGLSRLSRLALEIDPAYARKPIITGEILPYLKELPALRTVVIKNLSITESDLEAFNTALPQCTFER